MAGTRQRDLSRWSQRRCFWTTSTRARAAVRCCTLPAAIAATSPLRRWARPSRSRHSALANRDPLDEVSDSQRLTRLCAERRLTAESTGRLSYRPARSSSACPSAPLLPPFKSASGTALHLLGSDRRCLPQGVARIGPNRSAPALCHRRLPPPHAAQRPVPRVRTRRGGGPTGDRHQHHPAAGARSLELGRDRLVVIHMSCLLVSSNNLRVGCID